jgi:uncharacterized membrane protein YoaK (UPF0700 family)
MNGQNMVGMTNNDVRRALESESWGCLIAGVCILALVVIAVGGLVYVACLRWAWAGHWAPVLGWTSAVYAAAVAVGKLMMGR